jgi:hypothetical protein
MVAGYPGRTSRHKTVFEWDEEVDWYFPNRVSMCEEYMGAMEKVTGADADAKVKGEPLYRGLANWLKYTRGALEGMSRPELRADKAKIEKRIQDQLEKDAPDTLKNLKAVFATREQTRDLDFGLWQMKRLSSMVATGYGILRTLDERQKPDAERTAGFQERDLKNRLHRSERFSKVYSRNLDSTLFALALHRTHRVLKEGTPKEVTSLKLPLGDLDALKAEIDELFSSSILEDPKARAKLLEKGTWADVSKSKDKLLRLMLTLYPQWRAEEMRRESRSGDMLLHRPTYLAALAKTSAVPVASDANSTLRVTYGTVRGYHSPKKPEPYKPFTVVEGVRAKATGEPPFHAPKKLLEAIDGKKGTERFAHKKLGTVPVDFLADLDITGGNSGSSTINGRGEIVGLAFDGNYEAMASDWLFMPEVTRSIHVDWRYVLWVMTAVDGAEHLYDEMKNSGIPQR